MGWMRLDLGVVIEWKETPEPTFYGSLRVIVGSGTREATVESGSLHP